MRSDAKLDKKTTEAGLAKRLKVTSVLKVNANPLKMDKIRIAAKQWTIDFGSYFIQGTTISSILHLGLTKLLSIDVVIPLLKVSRPVQAIMAALSVASL